jgi:hypothetical protein
VRNPPSHLALTRLISSLIPVPRYHRALAQASMSSTSLAINASTATATRAKFAIPRIRTRTEPGCNRSSGAVSSPPGSSPISTALPPLAVASRTDRHDTRSYSPTPSSVFSNSLGRADTRASSRPESPSGTVSHEYVHPYANPDVSSPYRDSMHTPPTMRPVPVPSRDSQATSGSLSIPRPASPQESISGGASPSIASGVDPSSYQSRRPSGTIQGRTISGPIPVDGGVLKTMPSSSSIRSRNRDTKTFAQPHHLPTGFAELPASPTFTLISLQEAQAQAKERSRSNTIQYPVPFLQQDPLHRSAPESVRGTGNRTRARSTSASGKAKSALQSLALSTTPSASSSAPNRSDLDSSPVSQTVPGGNVLGSGGPRLKHKKSGFMRLFNGKDKEADEPPPVPSLSAAAPISSLPPAPRSTRPPQARVPVPQLTPDEDYDDRPRHAVQQRRGAPPLAIVPPSERQHNSFGLYGSVDGNPSRATLMANPPASAPPSAGQFPSLSLRPVSTVFSAHFAEALGGEFSLDLDGADARTTTSGFSPTSALSPVTPHSRHEHEAFAVSPSGGGGGADGDAHAVIQALQAQLAGARKAWQRQIWELEGQVRDLRAEAEETRSRERAGARCVYCGRGGGSGDRDGGTPAAAAIPAPRKSSLPAQAAHPGYSHGIVNRPRARTGVGAHFGSAT